MMYGIQVSKNRAIDFGFFYKIRKFKDGITFFEFVTNLDLYKGDHNPKFKICLVFINFIIFELNFYNTEEKDFSYD